LAGTRLPGVAGTRLGSTAIKAEDVSIQAMRDKGLDPENRKLRRYFTRRILVSFHDLKKAGALVS
jgi:hypothetical protein